MSRIRFPKGEIEERLRDWWARKVARPLRRRTKDPMKKGGTVFDVQPEVSSTEAVEVFIEIEPLLGFKIKGSRVVRRGGYRTCDDFVQHMLPRLETEFTKHHAVLAGIGARPSKEVRPHVN